MHNDYYVDPAALDLIDPPEPVELVARPGHRLVEGVEIPLRCPECGWPLAYEAQSRAFVRVTCRGTTTESGHRTPCGYRREFPR
jgi:hypothetical protein